MHPRHGRRAAPVGAQGRERSAHGGTEERLKMLIDEVSAKSSLGKA
ncbi:hypothetical protein X739_17755 [Mesorhizobium sp. LNHC220B00]|nr:hypothetical protein [Mesorhizobium sp. LNHC220B00]ESY85089.1 hypothetical protein X739_17755 [Mesorhizobium sp. LNHC220B00]